MVGASLSMMVSDSVLSPSGEDMTATRELAEERTIHRYHVDARAVGAHGDGLKRSSACLNTSRTYRYETTRNNTASTAFGRHIASHIHIFIYHTPVDSSPTSILVGLTSAPPLDVPPAAQPPSRPRPAGRRATANPPAPPHGASVHLIIPRGQCDLSRAAVHALSMRCMPLSDAKPNSHRPLCSALLSPLMRGSAMPQCPPLCTPRNP